MNEKIEVGDAVAHKSNPYQRMVALSITGENVRCSWMSNGKRCEDEFVKAELERYKGDEVITGPGV